MCQKLARGIAKPSITIGDLPQNRADSLVVTENPSSGSHADTNTLITYTSNENRRRISEQPTPTPGGHLPAATRTTTSPDDAPYVDEVVPDKGPITGELRISIAGTTFVK